MKFPVKVRGKELLDSSVVHLGSNDEVTLEVDNLIIKFIFEDDMNDNSSRYNGGGEGNTFTMTLTNFNNGLGEGVLTPLEIGFYNKRRLYTGESPHKYI